MYDQLRKRKEELRGESISKKKAEGRDNAQKGDVDPVMDRIMEEKARNEKYRHVEVVNEAFFLWS